MTVLDTEIATYEANEADFLASQLYKWVMISGQKVHGFYEDIDSASEALKKIYAGQPVLLRQIGMDRPAYPLVQYATL